MFSVSEASVAVITGGSSGIGLNAARALRDRGLNVYELSRRAENAEPGVTHLQADVTDETQVNAAVAEILRREGRIDILINNAGFGISGAIEFTPPQEARRQFDVNFFGMVNMNRAVLPVMRQQGGRPHREHELRRGAHRHSVSGLLLGLQGRRAHVFARARKRGASLRHRGLRHHAGRHRHRLYRRAAQKLRRRRRVQRPHRPLRRRDGARRADRYERAVRGAVRCPARHAKASQAHLHHGRKYALFVFLMRILPTRTATRIVGRIYAS